ncbi:hypothetical protein JCM8202v2_005300 [Rhodotorula sphaerocarpa]
MAETAPAESVGFLRSTAQRAGQFALAAPRYAVARTVPDAVQRRIASWTDTAIGVLYASEVEMAAGAGATHRNSATSSSSSSSAAAAAAGHSFLPSPITYLTSAYLVTSLALAFLLHRIHHLVPPRQSYTTHAATARRPGVRGLQQGMRRVMLPAVQLGCRLPAVLLLLKAIVALALALSVAQGVPVTWLGHPAADGTGAQWGSLFARTAQTAARTSVRTLAALSAWSGGRNLLRPFLDAATDAQAAAPGPVHHASLLWQCYLAICTTVACETFVRALSDDLPHAQHQFNLLSFSFLLHIHSGPTPTRAGHGKYTELYTYLLLTLVEILALQISYCAPHLPLVRRLDARYRAWLGRGANRPHATSARVYRLPLTAIFSLLGQYYAVRSWARLFRPSAAVARAVASPGSAASAEAVVADRIREVEDLGTVWLNKAPEVTLELIVGVSVALKALAAAIRGEELSVENLVGPRTLAPQPEEDYAVAMIKYATHLLSTTRLSGLAHELSPLEVLPLSVSSSLETLGFLEPPPCESDDCPVHGAENRAAAREAREIAANGGGQEVVLQRNGDVVFWDLIALDASGNDLPGQEGVRNRIAAGGGSSGGTSGGDGVVGGFANEIRRVSVESPYGAETDADGYAADGSWTGAPAAAGSSSGFLPFSRRMGHVEGERRSALWRLLGLCARIVVYVLWRGYRFARGVGRGVLAKTIGWRRDEWEMERRWGGSGSGSGRRGAQQALPRGAGGSPPAPVPSFAELAARLAAATGAGARPAGAAVQEDEEDDGEWLPDGEASDEEEEDGDFDGEEEVEVGEDRDASGWESDPNERDEDAGSNPLVLYSDLSRPRPRRSQSGQRFEASDAGGASAYSAAAAGATFSPEELAPYLLAHHLSSDRAGPLTRRRYRALVPGGPSASSGAAQDGGVSALSTAIDRRRGEVLRTAREAASEGGSVAQWMEDEREKWRDGRSRFCVVCTVEERTVVLWPCPLTERTTSSVFDGDGAGPGGSSGQLCPTCRTPVQGFSRIYVP